MYLYPDIELAEQSLLENVVEQVSIAEGKVYIRKVLVTDADSEVISCNVYDTFGGWSYDPMFIGPQFQEDLRDIEKTEAEKVHCVQNLPTEQ